MDIKHLINLLPPIFKAQDTYKVNGKGFLERYLEICGSYLTDIITPDIDNILDIIQIDTTPKEYLNYLWEFLGEIPFANVYTIDKSKWDINHDNTNANEDTWLIKNNIPIVLSDQTARDIIKYSLSLYKIRGTKKFFDTLLRLYGMECTIQHEDPDYEVITPYLDTSYLDKDNLDIDYECSQCSKLIIDIRNNNDYGGQSFVFSDLITSYNNYDGKIDFDNLSILPSDVRLFVNLRKLLESFFDRFTPYNANILLTYDGIAPDDNVKFDVVYDDPDNSIITKDNTFVNLKIVTDSKWPVLDNRYRVSRNGVEWNGKYHDGNLYSITNPGTYYFKMASSDKIIPVSVGSSTINQPYTLSIKEGNIIYLSDFESGNATITPMAKFGDILVDTTIEFPDGSKSMIKSGESVSIVESGKYKIYVTTNPEIYITVYVYNKPFSLTSRVDIPYGLKVTIDTPAGEIVIGAPDDNTTVPVAMLIYTEENKVTGIEPWLRDPDDLSHILYGSEFITDTEHVVHLMNRAYSENEENDVYIAFTSDTSIVPLSSVSIGKAIELINLFLGESQDQSFLLTLAQANISKYYEPYNIDQSTQSQKLNYLHNPVFINSVAVKSSDSITSQTTGDRLIVNKNNGAGDVFIIGAILMDNRYPSIRFPIWYDTSPNPEFTYPFYTATLQFDGGSNKSVDLSPIKLKDKNSNTIRRQLVVFGRKDFSLVNTTPVFISDSGSGDSGLYINYLNLDDPLSSLYWSTEVLPEPLTITKRDGQTIDISKIYTVKLNNGVVGRQYANFRLQVIFDGIYYDDRSEGGIVVDDRGNSYNLRTRYIEDTIRYYIPVKNGSPLRMGGHGHIFSVKSHSDDPNFNIMLNIVIDEKASDRLDIEFDMDPEVFYLPTNGKIAITNMIASRPYKFEPDADNSGVFIYGPLESETEDNEDELIRDPSYEYTTGEPGQYTFSAEGVVDPLSVLAGKPEYPGSSEEKVFTVHKNI